MIRGIIISVILGLLFGVFLAPDILVNASSTIINCALVFLIFTIGIDLGMQNNLWRDIKKEGFVIIMLPFTVIFGTLTMGTLTAIILPYSPSEMLAVSAGLGWYSLVPAMLMKYSSELSAVSFLHNVMRELGGMILIPIVAKKVGWLESIGVPGGSTMDVCLPVIEKCTSPKMAVYAFVNGALISIIVPFLITAIMEIFLIK